MKMRLAGSPGGTCHFLYEQHLKLTYQRLIAMRRGLEPWEDETGIGGAMAMVVHTANHLGEIQQALCTLR